MKLFRLNFEDKAKCLVCGKLLDYRYGYCTLDFVYYCEDHIPRSLKIEYSKIEKKKKRKKL